MLTALLNDVDVWQPILLHPIFKESLVWLEKHAATADLGNHPLNKPGWYANVHGYATLTEHECVWENHTHTIDIQYLVRGCERIRWTAADQLGRPVRFFEELDRQEFDEPVCKGSVVNMLPGMFALFMPGEAHCPKIALDRSEQLHKVVIKIPIHLLEDYNELPSGCGS